MDPAKRGQNIHLIRRNARVAGLLYLFASVPAAFSWVYVPNKVIVTGDATATADHLRRFETLFRLGIASELVGLIMFIFVVLTLYRLFEPVSQRQARAMAILLLISLPVSFVAVVNEIAALTVVSGASFLSALNQNELEALSYLFIRLHGQTLVVAQIFWGLWLVPFGILVIRSGFIPRFLGYLLFLAAAGYIANSAAALVMPAYRHAVAQFADRFQMLEMLMILWLLIFGARVSFVRQQPVIEATA